MQVRSAEPSVVLRRLGLFPRFHLGVPEVPVSRPPPRLCHRSYHRGVRLLVITNPRTPSSRAALSHARRDEYRSRYMEGQ
jgi:hypothetical protein